ncbi:MAG TPA: FMN-binding protein [Acidimicrobiia bacterium]|jgi:uncharacterized protein with FMN-binding domain|nr:FMN-binding protein [Acidimicrobiia bacterium]
MNRAVPVVITTFIGLAALASFKSSPGLPSRSATTHTVKPLTPVATAPPTTPPTNPPSGSTGTAASGTTPHTTPPATAANQVRTFDGDPFDNRYGTVQVRVTLRGTQITSVTALQMPSDRQRSAEISQGSEPILQQEALQAQSATIDVVSGASYTSQSYADSLQSALAKAGR